ncbi:hypothetical protein B0H14DRAFT_3641317 [Mycena olivaceomarginata]|nr:hypothetical protein B0H14DRAFT_3641317 [Mycena olivaceomarginata]
MTQSARMAALLEFRCQGLSKKGDGDGGTTALVSSSAVCAVLTPFQVCLVNTCTQRALPLPPCMSPVPVLPHQPWLPAPSLNAYTTVLKTAVVGSSNDARLKADGIKVVNIYMNFGDFSRVKSPMNPPPPFQMLQAAQCSLRHLTTFFLGTRIVSPPSLAPILAVDTAQTAFVSPRSVVPIVSQQADDVLDLLGDVVRPKLQFTPVPDPEELRLRADHPHWFLSPSPPPLPVPAHHRNFVLVDFARNGQPAIVQTLSVHTPYWIRPGNRPYESYSLDFSRWMKVEPAYSHRLQNRTRILIRSLGVKPPCPTPVALPPSNTVPQLGPSTQKKRTIEPTASDDEVEFVGYRRLIKQEPITPPPKPKRRRFSSFSTAVSVGQTPSSSPSPPASVPVPWNF